MQWGTPEQKQRYIPRISHRLRRYGARVCQNPTTAPTLAAVETRAVDRGDHFLVNGSKVWTSNAHRADFTTLLCRTDPDAPKHKGLSYLLVDMKVPASPCAPLVQITGRADSTRCFLMMSRSPWPILLERRTGAGWSP